MGLATGRKMSPQPVPIRDSSRTKAIRYTIALRGKPENCMRSQNMEKNFPILMGRGRMRQSGRQLLAISC